MKINLSKIEKFYETDLGKYVHTQIEKYLIDTIKKNQKICVLSAAGCFYIDSIKNKYAAMPIICHDEQGKMPLCGQGKFVQIDSLHWPFRAEDIDHIILIHDIEFIQNPEAYLHEAWRVLKGEGEITILFPNREGRWAQYDATPFGKGYPFSYAQMEKMLSRAHFTIDDVRGLLHFPPYEPKTGIGKFFRYMVDCSKGFFMYRPGVYALKISKHIHAPIGGGLKEMAKNVGRALQPQSVPVSNRK